MGAIGIVRLSGARAIIIADTIFKGKRLENQPSHTAHFGKIETPDGRVLDEVLVTVLLPVPPGRWGGAGFVFFDRATFVFALALGCDLVDLAYDSRHGLATLVFQKLFC